MGKDSVEIESPNGCVFTIHDPGHGRVTMQIKSKAPSVSNVVSIDIAELASALNEVVPGFVAKYTRPVKVPTYLGAVVEREASDRHLKFQRFVRWSPDDESSLPWMGRDGTKYSNDDIAAILVNGGYERQPDFPRNG